MMQKTIQIIKPNKQLNSVTSNAVRLKKRVAAYARVSTDYEDQLNSYKVQCDSYSQTITSNPNYIFAGLFADQGISGTQAKKRPEFMKMIQSAKDGNIDLILTKSISRFGRNTVDVITYIRELREIGVEIYFEKENISSLDPKIDFMLTILSSIAQEESRAISSNVKWAIEKKAKDGIVDPRRIYGYNVADGKYSINENEVEVIKLIFTLALKGYNINDIVKILNNKSILTMKGSTWKYGAVRHILQNERYCGDALLRKTVCIDYLTKKTVKNDNIVDKYYVSNNHVPIISREMFEDVQTILNQPSTALTHSNKITKYPLTGLIYCPKCGRTLKRQHIKSGNHQYVILNCNHAYNNMHICKSGSPKYDLVIGSALESINELISNKTYFNTLLNHLDIHTHLESLRTQKTQIKGSIRSLHESLELNSDNESFMQEITTLETTLSEIEIQMSIYVSTQLKLEYIKSLTEFDEPNESINFKDIYSMILADEQRIRFIISSTKIMTQLVNEIPNMLNSESMLSKMYVSKDGNSGIFYEVILYE